MQQGCWLISKQLYDVCGTESCTGMCRRLITGRTNKTVCEQGTVIAMFRVMSLFVIISFQSLLTFYGACSTKTKALERTGS